jgi:hypothetical protein
MTFRKIATGVIADESARASPLIDARPRIEVVQRPRMSMRARMFGALIANQRPLCRRHRPFYNLRLTRLYTNTRYP